MTKKIRIENADTSDWKVVVEVWDKGSNGEPDKLSETREIHYPTQLAEVHIHGTRYLVVKEV